NAGGRVYSITYNGGDGNDVVLTDTTVGVTRTWTGGGANDLWSNGDNWAPYETSPGVFNTNPPNAGDDLLFPDTAVGHFSNTNDLTAGRFYHSISFSGSSYTLAGNSIVLGGGNPTVSDSAGAGSNTIAFNMTLGATRTITNAATTLIVSGVLSGPGGLTKEGAGTLILSAANTYSGATIVSAGVLNVVSNAALGDTATGTTVGDGATLQVQGGLTAMAEPLHLNGNGAAGVGALENVSGANTVTGAVSLATDSTVAVD